MIERSKESTIGPRILLAAAMLIALAGAFSVRYWSAASTHSSFSVYYTAACLIRANLNLSVYDAVKPGVNPQLEIADPATVFAQTARAHGIPSVMLYLYPPTMADLLVPLTFLSPAAAFIAWDILSLILLVAVSFILTRAMKIPAIGWTALILVFLILFRPTLNCFYFGQASILLLFLLIAGMSLYVRGNKNVAGLLFALAVAIKLTPIIVIVPFLAWRDWKILRAIALWGAGILGALWIVNGSAALSFYFQRVLPSMSGGNLGSENYSENNRTLGAIVYQFFGGADRSSTPVGLVWAVRILSVLVICYAGWLSRAKEGDKHSDIQKLWVVSIFLLLSCCLSPFSWLYAWVLSAPALVLLGQRIAQRRSTAVETALLFLFLLSLLTSKHHLGLVTPPLGVALGLIGLHRPMKDESSGVLRAG